jgi:hypothetical protein
MNGDNVGNVRHEASRTFRTKKREYLKDKINKFETNNKIKNIRDLCRGITEFKNGCRPRSNLVKKISNIDLLADSHSILNRWKNYFCQILNVEVSYVRQNEVHTAEPLVPDPSSFKVKIAVEKLERYK